MARTTYMSILKISKFYFFLPLFAFLISCQPGKPDDGFLIQGKIEKINAAKPVVLLKLEGQEFVVVDSTRTDENGEFKFIGKVADGGQFMLLNIYDNQNVLFIGDNKEIEINAEGAENGRFTLKGTADNEFLQRVLTLEEKKQKELQPMQYEVQLAAVNNDEQRMKTYIGYIERANAYYRNRFKNLIDSGGVSIVSLYATHNLDMDDDFAYLDSLNTKFKKEKPDAIWTKEFSKSLDDRRVTAIGTTAPPFSLPTPEGKKLSPSDFAGKILVMDFWASWCGPCRKNNPELVSIYKKYNGQDVEFLGVSLDKEREPWLAAIKADNLTWPQVSDLKFWDSEAAQAYQIKQIPTLIIVGRDGKIVAKNLEGEALDKKLKQLIESV